MPTKFVPEHDYSRDAMHLAELVVEPVEGFSSDAELATAAGPSLAPPVLGDSRGLSWRHLAQDVRTGGPLLMADCLGLLLSMGLAFLCVMFLFHPHLRMSLAAIEWQVASRCSIFILVYVVLGLYPGVGLNPMAELKHLTLATLTGASILMVASATFGRWYSAETMLMLLIGAFALPIAPLFRLTAREILGACRWWGQPVLIVGAGHSGSALYQSLLKRPENGLKPVGIVDDFNVYFRDHPEQDHPRYLGPLSDISQIAAERGAYWALIALSDRPDGTLPETLEMCAAIPNVVVVPGLEELPSLWNHADDFGGMLGIHVRERLLCRSAQITKRIFDVAAVICGGLVLSPLLLPLLAVHWVSIRLYSPGPLFYGQERIGKDGRRFLAWKLRTMVIDAERTLQTYLLANPQMKEEWDRNQKLRHDPRVLPGVGQLLRKSSLDELPQLWNVLVADMSLVGPRPFTPDQLEMYGKVFSLYRKVRPGITGLWQISGRNLTTFEERAKFDAYYVRNWSLWLDVFILGRTIRTVLFREGAY